jgi:hypothetical protein
MIGLIAFGVVGYFGYDPSTRIDTNLVEWVFLKPWPLYLWFGWLIVILQLSVLRHSSLARQRRSAFLATGISLIVVGLVYLFHRAIQNCIEHPDTPTCPLPIPHLGGFFHDPRTYVIANGVIIVLLLVLVFLRWLRRRRGELFSSRLDLRTGTVIRLSAQDLPSADELAAGGLIGAGLSIGVLTALFAIPLIAWTTCGSQPIAFSLSDQLSGQCASGGGLSVALIDFILASLILAFGLVMLGLLVQEDLLKRLGRADASRPGASGSLAGRPAHPPTAVEVGQEAARTLMLILLRPVRSRGRRAAQRQALVIGYSVRGFLWRSLVVAAVVGIGALSLGLQASLHTPKFYEAAAGVAAGSAQCPAGMPDLSFLSGGPGGILDWIRLALTHGLCAGLSVYVMGLLGDALAVFGTVFALAVLLGDSHVVVDMLRFLKLIGYSVFSYFWIFVGALFAFSQGLRALGGCYGQLASSDYCKSVQSHPFDPGLLAILSFVVMVGFAASVLRNRRRAARARRQMPPASPPPASPPPAPST